MYYPFGLVIGDRWMINSELQWLLQYLRLKLDFELVAGPVSAIETGIPGEPLF